MTDIVFVTDEDVVDIRGIFGMRNTMTLEIKSGTTPEDVVRENIFLCQTELGNMLFGVNGTMLVKRFCMDIALLNCDGYFWDERNKTVSKKDDVGDQSKDIFQWYHIKEDLALRLAWDGQPMMRVGDAYYWGRTTYNQLLVSDAPIIHAAAHWFEYHNLYI